MVDKGGCSIGRKKEPKGGCKVGKKKIETKKKIKFNVVKKAPPKKKKAPAKKKEPKLIYPVTQYNIRDGKGGNVDQYAVHKGKIYKYIKFIGDRTGHIDISETDIKDKSIINKIKKIDPDLVLVRDKKTK